METKHTTGPWVIDWNVSRLDIFGADETTLVASLRRSTLSQAIDEAARSNARLIALAPELAEFVVHAKRVLLQSSDAPYREEMIAEADALLAKLGGAA